MSFRFQDIRHVVYINLPSRSDRRKRVERELTQLGWSPQRLEAIWYFPGAIGCSLSHVKALEYAKQQTWDHVLICEDDVEFLPSPDGVRAQLDQFFTSVPEWDVVLLNAHVFKGQRVSDTCAHIDHAHATTCYLVKQGYFDRLLENFRVGVQQYLRFPTQNHKYAIDVYWNHLMRQDRWFLPLPLIATQHSGPSDLVAEHQHEDYTKMFQDAIEKNVQ